MRVDYGRAKVTVQAAGGVQQPYQPPGPGDNIGYG
jgi:hypothetical protein